MRNYLSRSSVQGQPLTNSWVHLPNPVPTHASPQHAPWVPAPSGATTKARPPRGYPKRGLRQRRPVEPGDHQGFHLLSGQQHSSCSKTMWHQGLELVRMRIVRLSKHGIRLNQDQSIQPQMLKDRGEKKRGRTKNKLQNHGKSGKLKKVWTDKHHREHTAYWPC